MFTLKIASVSVCFSKFFSPTEGEAVLAAITEVTRRVVFVDTGVTPVLADTIRALVERGVEVHIRDHHRGDGRTPEAAGAIEALLGNERAKIVTRAASPACAGLVGLGEFATFCPFCNGSGEGDAGVTGCHTCGWTNRVGEGTVIVADPDLDGLTTAMKAAGVTYPGMDSDAEIFDVRPRQSAETLTTLGWTAVRALATLPAFDAAKPKVSEEAKAEIFGAFVAAASGDTTAREGLESRVSAYETGVAEAKRLLAEKVSRPCAAVVLVDTVGAKRSDLNSLSKGMERLGAKVTIIRKGEGPIAKSEREAGRPAVQFSLGVVVDAQKEIDLRTFVPEGTLTGVPAGLLSNVPFLLHCSEKVWKEIILPELVSKFGG